MYDDVYSAESIAGLGIVFWIFYITFIIFFIIVQWKIYVKAGKPGWGCIVPIYNVVLQLQIACRPIWWIFLLLIPFVNIFFAVVIVLDIAKTFGKESIFEAGLLFLSFIFFPILAFDSSEYTEIER